MRSAKTAIRSMATTISPPNAPRGLRRANRAPTTSPLTSQTDRPRSSAGRARVTSRGGSDEDWRPPPSALVADSGIEDGIERVHPEVDDDDRRHDHEVDALDHGVV